MSGPIVSLSVGTLGDAKLFIALNRGLMRAGYEVRLGLPENFLPLAEAAGIPAFRCGGDFKAVMQSGEIRRFVAGSAGRQLAEVARPPKALRGVMKGAMIDAVHGVKGASAIIAHPLVPIARDIAESLGVPWALVSPAPLTPNRDAPLFLCPHRSYGGWLNRLSYRLLDYERLAHLPVLNELRQSKLGLAPLHWWQVGQHTRRYQPDAMLYPFSSALFRPPGDWPKNAHLTGYWFDDEPAVPLSRDVEAFLEAGPAPVFVGFGSMTAFDRERAAVLSASVHRAGLRAIVATGWSSGTDGVRAVLEADDVCVVEDVPHRSLFSRVCAVVHHGGLGTHAAGLRAGCPTLVCPLTMDQPFWGYRIAEIGAGPEPLPMSRWTVSRLSQALTDVATNAAYRVNAKRVSTHLATEDGLQRAVEVIERLVPKLSRREQAQYKKLDKIL